MIDTHGNLQTVPCTFGVQQSFVQGAVLFNIALHAVVGQKMRAHNDVIALLHADNITFVGPVSACLLAAQELGTVLQEGSLRLNPAATSQPHGVHGLCGEVHARGRRGRPLGGTPSTSLCTPPPPTTPFPPLAADQRRRPMGRPSQGHHGLLRPLACPRLPL
uniref:Reverse transcriptase domain-containing protein n=1 Tax=Hemiselmis andersenii TaxID=464988 RepID=A0A6U2E1U6_HEMAN